MSFVSASNEYNLFPESTGSVQFHVTKIFHFSCKILCKYELESAMLSWAFEPNAILTISAYHLSSVLHGR